MIVKCISFLCMFIVFDWMLNKINKKALLLNCMGNCLRVVNRQMIVLLLLCV